MKIFDTHCHIADPAFDEDRAEVISRFRESGVCRANVVADPCEEDPNQEKVFSLVEQYDFLCASIGAHPHNASRYDESAERTILEYLNHPKCRLLGEIGLDYHYDLSPREVQKDVFDRQLELAYVKQVPVQLHIREAHGDCMDMLRSRLAAGRMPAGVMHCYTGSWEAAKVYLDAGLYISLSGALTFKNAPKLQEVCRNVPADRLLIETDCPYMAPVPLRGRRNEPAFITHTLAKAAQLREISPERMAEQLYANALRIFGLSDEA
ncbi:MAG: TatD family hydrolase [Eubacteriales bacterium]|nr:TatD family hydrolase [Eubacteriales bacterium]